MKKRIGITLVVPAYNSPLNFPEKIHSFIEFIKQQQFSVEVIIVDDKSSNKLQAEIYEKLLRKEVKIYILKEKMGQHAAVAIGCKLSSKDITITTDDDFPYNEEQIGKLLKDFFERNSDLSYMSPTNETNFYSKNLFHNICSYLGNKIICLFLRINQPGSNTRIFYTKKIQPLIIDIRKNMFVDVQFTRKHKILFYNTFTPKNIYPTRYGFTRKLLFLINFLSYYIVYTFGKKKKQEQIVYYNYNLQNDESIQV